MKYAYLCISLIKRHVYDEKIIETVSDAVVVCMCADSLWW